MKKVKNHIYNILIDYLPFRLMYKKYYFNGELFIWIPRWGYSNKQMNNAKKFRDKFVNLKWD